jgi:hypothetical protein
MKDPQRALFQLAHECIHLLDPDAGGTNKLEEGLATHFALDIMKSQGVDYSSGDPRYDAACNLARKVLEGWPTAVKQLRAKYGPWKSVTEQQILEECAGIAAPVAHELASPF